MQIPTHSIVIPWADRPVIEQTLASNQAVFARHAAETVIVNGGGDHERLLDLVRRSGVPDVRIIHLPVDTFNRSMCQNIGALASRGTYLFLLDADILVTSDVLGEATAQLQASRCFVCVRRVFESEPEVARGTGGPDLSFIAEMVERRTIVTTDGRRAVLSNYRLGRTRGGDGLVVVRKQDLLDVGGLNSQLTGWGYEDTDFQLRLQFLLGLERVDVGDVTHLTHPSSQRDQQSWNRNMMQAFDNYVRHQYLGTLEQDALASAGVPATA
jgi:predicted glycosyltransferase involved in capsule biosynthesis